jgi:hypothetical protein
MAAIPRFLEILADGPRDASLAFNPWRDHDARDGSPQRKTPEHRRANMTAYLEARRASARVLLLGEAPSHRGCRFTGIAFCSEVELLRKPDLVANHALALTSINAATKPMRERSAAVIWDELDKGNCARGVVLWNAFPWHPFQEGEPASNRRPKRTEVEEGQQAFEALLACFARKLFVFAVGKVAEAALAELNATSAGCIRHPSMGGERLFRTQFRQHVLPHF